MITISNIDKPYKIFGNKIEQGALDQFESAMNNHFVVRGALMPDAHLGYSMPIGGVVETFNAILPSWVGYDIGCGVCAIPTTFSVNDIKGSKDRIFDLIHRYIPVGFKHRGKGKGVNGLDNFDNAVVSPEFAELINEKKAWLQMGTLGGGNHFIEIGSDNDDKVWITIHSGSRGIGHSCGVHYMRMASPTGKASEGHFALSVNSDAGKAYIKDMKWCLTFALANREAMIIDVIRAINDAGIEGEGILEDLINRNHNHADSKDGEYWIHRKGATHAEKDMMGVIPGNMRDGSFIVRGLGNEDSLCSSSHGAGRVLGRKKAKSILDVDVFKLTMMGIKARVGKSTLDESPDAYKNIYEVMELQKDLVTVTNHVKPIIVVKG